MPTEPPGRDDRADGVPAPGEGTTAPDRAVVVGTDQAGTRLDVFLASILEIGSRSRAKELIQGGHVRVLPSGGKLPRVKAGLGLDPGTRVEFRLEFGTPEPEGEPLAVPDITVLFEDAHIAVIDKPPTLSVHPSTAVQQSAARDATIADWFVTHCGPTAAALAAPSTTELPSQSGPYRPGIVHRLDRDTSGVMVLAKTGAAMDDLRGQFKERSVRKEYRALTFGVPRFESDWIEKPLAPNPRHGDRMVVVRPGEGKEASTFYEVVERFDGFTMFACRPRTGRTHQIRVHMTSIGHSLVGDRIYRSRNRQGDVLPEGAPDPARQCLHALRLAFRHPRTGEELEFEAPLPADIADLVEWLRQHRPV